MSSEELNQATDFIRSLYLQHCMARFDAAVEKGELPEDLLRYSADAINNGGFVAKADANLVVEVSGGKKHPWSLAGMNAEYLVQLAFVSLLREALGPDEAHRIRVEWKKADIVVLSPGPYTDQTVPPVILQVEVKTTRSGMLTDKRAAGKPGSAVSTRIKEIRPRKILFGYADLDDLLWQDVSNGVVVGEASNCTWAAVQRLIAHRK